MTTMKSAIEKILTAHQQLDAFRATDDYSVKIASEGFMPLSIEKHGKQITVTHYFEQNGDLVPDPDMEFVDLGGEDWLPVAIQHATGHYCVAAQQAASGNWLISKGAMRDLKSFSRMWARNLLSNIRLIARLGAHSDSDLWLEDSSRFNSILDFLYGSARHDKMFM